MQQRPVLILAYESGLNGVTIYVDKSLDGQPIELTNKGEE
jgi:ribonucleotide reductase alpha subunit